MNGKILIHEFLKNKQLIVLLSFLLFLSNSQAQFDYQGMQSLHSNRKQNFDPFFKVVTHSVTPVMFALPVSSLGTWVITKDKKYLRNTFLQLEAMAINGLITLSLKELVKRPRPFVTYPEFDNLVSAGSYSFPSGHTSSAFNTATALTLSCPKWYLIVPAYTWASLAGYSRIHLGVHYPTDVLMGAFVGSGSAVAGYYLNQWINNIQKTKKLKSKL